jgi:23S rRNA U2552 (ribose-2'-O)-methylase RlmE/FtsJ
MVFFQLPVIPYDDNIEINITFSNDIEPLMNLSLFAYLLRVKNQIDERKELWDCYKKYTNPYEFIHTTVPYSSESVCKIKPVSRSYFKMIEINDTMKISQSLPINCKTFHLAEGPGGFIEALCNIRNNHLDTYYGMTLLRNEDSNVPGWNKSEKFLCEHSNVITETGKTRDGDLTKIENFEYCFRKYKGTMDLITADGGFDFTIEFNNQELASMHLIFCQIAFAIAMQKKGGTFILKVFDTFTKTSEHILYLLSLLYNEVSLIKPNTSRYANSEKYIVCKKFRLDDTKSLFESFKTIFGKNKYVSQIFQTPIPYFYRCKIEEYNAIYGQQQIETIIQTLNLIDNNKTEKIEGMKKMNINKCILWCEKHNMPYNKSLYSNNMFLSKSSQYIQKY